MSRGQENEKCSLWSGGAFILGRDWIYFHNEELSSLVKMWIIVTVLLFHQIAVRIKRDGDVKAFCEL